MPASKKPKEPKVCRNCSITFMSNNIRQVSCSPRCNIYYMRKQNPEEHRKYAASLMRAKSPDKKAADAVRKRENRLIKQYGISHSEFLKMKAEQQERCFLCAKFSSKLVIDHNHKTGKVRKLLCHHCNRGLGFLQDSAELLSAAAQYLRTWGA